MTKVLIPLADGSEELEAITVINLFRRAGYKVDIAGESSVIEGARKTKILCDILIYDVPENHDYDLILLPGGKAGVDKFKTNIYLKKLVSEHYFAQNYTAAVCAAPLALQEYGVINENSKITSFPSLRKELNTDHYLEDSVVVDGKLITSRGVGTSIDFALRIVEIFSGKEKARSIAEEIVYTK